MAYKRRRLAIETPSFSPSSLASSSKPRLLSQANFTPRGGLPSSPRLPTLPRQQMSGPRVSMSCERSEPLVRNDTSQGYDAETDAEILEREGADAMNEVVMAIDMKERGTIGCAYYTAREEKLFMIEDMKLAGLEIIDILKLHAQPSIIIISTRSDEKLEEHLGREARSIDRRDDASEFAAHTVIELANNAPGNISGSYILDTRPSSDFNYVTGRNKLTNLELTCDGGFEIAFTVPGEELACKEVDNPHQGRSGRQGRLMKLAGRVDLDSRLTACL